MKEFYIMSLKHSPIDFVTAWWRPNNAGYTKFLNEAGIYSQADVEEKSSYYNNGISTRAILIEDAEEIAKLVVLYPESTDLSSHA